MDEYEYTVYVDSAAASKMFRHINFLKRVSASAAMRLYDNFCHEIDSLNFNPEGRPRYFLQKKAVPLATLHYKLCAKRHRIIFDIDGCAVYIHDIQDCRQHANKSLV